MNGNGQEFDYKNAIQMEMWSSFTFTFKEIIIFDINIININIYIALMEASQIRFNVLSYVLRLTTVITIV